MTEDMGRDDFPVRPARHFKTTPGLLNLRDTDNPA